MARQIESDDTEALRDVGIAELVAIFATVGARGVEADQRNALARLFIIDAIFLPRMGDVDVAPNDRIGLSHFRLAPEGLDSAGSVWAHLREHPGQRAQILPEDLGVALDLELAVQRMGHRPDVV